MTKALKIALLSGEQLMREALAGVLQKANGVRRVIQYAEPGALFAKLPELAVDAVLIDMDHAGPAPERVIGGVVRARPGLPVLLLARGDRRLTAARALRLGASGLFSKSDPLAQLPVALAAVGRGELWASRAATAEALAKAPAREPAGGVLTRRESELLELLREGFRNKEIAARLGITEHTVKAHLYSLYKKLGARTRIEAALAGGISPGGGGLPAAGSPARATTPDRP